MLQLARVELAVGHGTASLPKMNRILRTEVNLPGPRDPSTR